MYCVKLSKRAIKEIPLLEQSKLADKASELLMILAENPFQNPPAYEKLKGLKSTYSRRLNDQHRLVYMVLPKETGERDVNEVLYQGIVRVQTMWTHYE